jgi:hypothetical protein
MRKAVAVSFEGEYVRIVYATLKRTGIEVNDALIVKDEQFDHFLEQEKTKEFIVVNDFKEFYQDIISVPPVKNKYIKDLIKLEIKNKAPDFKDFSFIHFLHSEKIIENKKVKEIFVFAVRNEEVKDIVNRFSRKGKTIKALYPNIFSVARLIKSIEDPFLCILETGLKKTLFLLKGGKVDFVRTTQAFDKGLNDPDIQNIYMTVNYCRQVMRVNPAFILLGGSLCNEYDATDLTTMPIACLRLPPFQTLKMTAPVDFIYPISSLFVSREKDINILTPDYKNFLRIRLFLKYSTLLFISLSLIGISYIGFISKNIMEYRNRLSSIRKTLPDIENTLILYENKRSELAHYMPFITFLRTNVSIPDIQRFLSLLSEMKTDNIRIDSLSIAVDGDILKSELKGIVKTKSFADMQIYYQKLIDSISNIEGFFIGNQGLILKDGSFYIEVELR